MTVPSDLRIVIISVVVILADLLAHFWRCNSLDGPV